MRSCFSTDSVSSAVVAPKLIFGVPAFSRLQSRVAASLNSRQQSLKLFLSALMLACTALGSSQKLVAAEPELSIPTVDAKQDQTVKTTVQYRADLAKVSAFQFDLQYDRKVISNISATLGPAAAAAGKTLASAVLSNGNIRYLVFGLNQTVIGDGAVITLKITIAPEAESGAYPLEMLNAVASNPNGIAVPIKVSSGRVVVIE